MWFGDVLAVIPFPPSAAAGASPSRWRLHGRSLPSHLAGAVRGSTIRLALLAADEDDLDDSDWLEGTFPRSRPGDWWALFTAARPLGTFLGQLCRYGFMSDGVELVVVLDPFCPLVPSSHLDAVVALARADPGSVVVAYRPMTDTVKSLVGDRIDSTVDRDRLRLLSSPLVLPMALVLQLNARGALAGCHDTVSLVDLLRAEGARLVWSAAPVEGRRIHDVASLAVLESLTEPG